MASKRRKESVCEIFQKTRAHFPTQPHLFGQQCISIPCVQYKLWQCWRALHIGVGRSLFLHSSSMLIQNANQAGSQSLALAMAVKRRDRENEETGRTRRQRNLECRRVAIATLSAQNCR